MSKDLKLKLPVFPESKRAEDMTPEEIEREIGLWRGYGSELETKLDDEYVWQQYGIKEGITREIKIEKGISIVQTCIAVEPHFLSWWRDPTDEELEAYMKGKDNG